MTAIAVKIEPEALLRVAVKTAIHEAGHATAALELDLLRDLVVGVSLGVTIQKGEVKTDGLEFTDPVRPENFRHLRTLERSLGALFAAGAAGERLIYGHHSAYAATGDRSMFYDLAIALAREAHWVAIGEAAHEALAQSVKDRWPHLLQRADRDAVKIIVRQYKLFEAVINALLAEGYLPRERLLALHERYAVAP